VIRERGVGAIRKLLASKWFWRILAVFVALQIYFVRELLAVFVLFTIGFAVVAGIALAFYLVEQAGERGVSWAEPHARQFVPKLRENAGKLAEELSKRPFRRPHSETAP
jgi:hypothetical protein